ncbi:MAG: amidohydrolase family protein, partial [Balneolaceae bacterium]
VLSNGVTTVHTGHAPGATASGQTMIAKTAYNTVEEAVLDSVTTVAFTFGSGVGNNFDTPGTRSKNVATLRQHFLKAEEYLEKRKDGEAEQNLQMDIMADVLEGKVLATFTAQKAHDIMSVLRLQEEFGFEMVLDGAAEIYEVMDEVKESGSPVFIHPTMVRPSGDTESASFETAKQLKEAGIPFAFQSGFEAYVPKTRIVLFEAGIAVANGLAPEDALRALTVDAARILGVENRIGSLKEGKDADLVLFNGDPFEYTTIAKKVIVDGNVVGE